MIRYRFRMRDPLRRGQAVVAHVGGATVRGTIDGRTRTHYLLAEGATINDQEMDGVYLLPVGTPMQVADDGPRAASGVKA